MVALLALFAGAALIPVPTTPPVAPSPVRSVATILIVSGDQISAETLELRGKELQVTENGQVRTIPLEQVIAVAGASANEASVDETDCSVVLRDGGVVNGNLLDGEDDLIRIHAPVLGDLDLPIEWVSTVALGAVSDRSDASTWESRGDQDVLFRRGGGVAGDAVAGTVLRVGSDGVSIESDDLGDLTLPAANVDGVVIADLEGVSPLKGTVDVELLGGSRIVGQLKSLTTGSVILKTVFAAALEIRMDSVRRVRFQSTLFRWLSDIDPVEVEETPFIGGSDDFLFGWKRDRSVTGELLQVNGRSFGKGLGMHSRSRLAFPLDGTTARFRAHVGVSDEVLRHNLKGALVVRIVVDGKVRFDSGSIRAGEPAVPVDIEIAGATQLVVEVDFGERGDIGDRAVIGDPMLLDS